MGVKAKDLTEFDVLHQFVKSMEQFGVSRSAMYYDLDEEEADKLSRLLGRKVALEELHKVADRCFANEWLEQASISSQYGCLRLTASGLGVVRSRLRKREELAKRSALKRASDYIENHKGLFTMITVLVGVVTLLLKGFAK